MSELQQQQLVIAASIPGVHAGMCEFRDGMIVGIYLCGEWIQTDDIRKLTGFMGLEELQLDCTGIVDDDVALLANFPRLHTLWLYETKLGDRGIAQLARLSTLERLGLRLWSEVSIESLGPLAQLPRLRELLIDLRSAASVLIDELRPKFGHCEFTIDW